jgi:hypothetical protein
MECFIERYVSYQDQMPHHRMNLLSFELAHDPIV